MQLPANNKIYRSHGREFAPKHYIVWIIWIRGTKRNQTRRTVLVGQTSHRDLQGAIRPAKTLCLVPLLNEPCSSKGYLFSDSVKDQEKALAKQKIQQELCETLAEEAVYRVAFNEDYQESEGESVHNLPTGFASNIDTFLHDQESYFPAQSSVTQSLKNVTQSSVPLIIIIIIILLLL